MLLATLIGTACCLLQDDDTIERLMGGRVEELRAVLGMDDAQAQRLRETAAAAESELAHCREVAAASGIESVRSDLEQLRQSVESGVRSILTPEQSTAYDRYVGRKKELEREYEMLLYGLPPVTEMRIYARLSEEERAALQAVAERKLGELTTRVREMHDQQAADSDIATEIQRLREETVTELGQAVRGQSRNRLQQYLQDYLRGPEERLDRNAQRLLDRAARALTLSDETARAHVRSQCASILVHRAETDRLREGLAREITALIVARRSDGDVWVRLNEFRSLIEARRRRIGRIEDRLKDYLPTSELGKLVAEGLIAG